MNNLDFMGGRDPGDAWLSGTLDATDWQAGRSGTLSRNVDIYSRNLEFGAVASLDGGTAMLELLINAHGEQKAAQPQYSPSDVTVTGLPVERASSQEAEAIIIGQFSLSNYQTIRTGHGQAELSIRFLAKHPMASISSS